MGLEKNHIIEIGDRNRYDFNATLVLAIESGELSAETKLAELYYQDLTNFIRSRESDRSIVEDVVQDTWLIVIEKLRNRKLRDPSKVKSFIWSIGVNRLIMTYRSRNKNCSELIKLELVESDSENPEEALVSKQLGSGIKKTFKLMSQQRDRDILQKFFLTNTSKADLSEKYNIKPAHFDRVIYRAKGRFANIWDSEKCRHLLNNDVL